MEQAAHSNKKPPGDGGVDLLGYEIKRSKLMLEQAYREHICRQRVYKGIKIFIALLCVVLALSIYIR